MSTTREVHPGCLHVQGFLDLEWQQDVLDRLRLGFKNEPGAIQRWHGDLWMKALIHMPDKSDWQDVKDNPDRVTVHWHEGHDEEVQDLEGDVELLRTGRPLVLISLGCTVQFRIGSHVRGMGVYRDVIAQSGDLVLMYGPSRLRYYWVTGIESGSSPLQLKKPVGVVLTMKETRAQR